MIKNTPVFLRPDIKLEPLIDHWYAWSHLIPPATAARNLTERHLAIMESFIAAPQIHVSAVKNPKMLGGPFIDYGVDRVDSVRELSADTKRKRRKLLELSAALTDVANVLRSNANGQSLQPLYERIPLPLKGYVELVYDLDSHASFRIIEPLLYRSFYYDRDAQSLMLSEIRGDDRPFILSTPRFESPEAIHLRVCFASDIVDRLFSLRTRPSYIADIVDIVGDLGNKSGLFYRFFTSTPPSPYEPYTGAGVRWRYFGHACILIETRHLNILFDPVLSYTYESRISRYTYQDLPEHIDYVVITHNHQDHILFETLLQIRHKVGTIVVPRSGNGALQDPSLKLLLEAIGFNNVVELGEFDQLSGNQLVIRGLPFFGEHADLNISSKLTYYVNIQGHSLLFAADACNIEPILYDHVARDVGSVDVLFIGMECDGAPLTWLYGPLLTRQIERAADQSRRLAGSNCEQALNLVDRFRCKEVYVYAMGQEPWLNYVLSLKYTDQSRPILESNRLIHECTRRGIVAERLFAEKEILMCS